MGGMLLDTKYKSAAIVGIVCGVLLAICSLIYTVVGQIMFGPEIMRNTEQILANPGQGIPGMSIGLSFASLTIASVFIITIVIFICSGALADYAAASSIKSRKDAVVTAVAAACVAEIVHRPFAALFMFVGYLIRPSSSTLLPENVPAASQAVSSIFTQAVCCFPFFLVMGIVLAGLGGLFYDLIRPKK